MADNRNRSQGQEEQREGRPERHRQGGRSDGNGPEGNGPEGNGPDGRIGPREAARKAMDYLEDISGTPPEMVTAVVPDDEGWYVSVELLELARVPDTSDILGCYEVTLDRSGEPLSYRRTRRYARTEVGDE